MIALGGNALLRSGQKGTYAEQFANVVETCGQLYPLIERGDSLVIAHGNGPQVGQVMLQQEAGLRLYGLEAMPMDFCGAETQGAIAYLIESGLDRVLHRHGVQRRTISLLTRVEVRAEDPMFACPTKPVGPYYTREEAERLQALTGAVYREDSKGNGWRKVVASPEPLRIQHVDIVREHALSGDIVITAGGGGIPVVRTDEGFQGVEAVVDKDLAAALCAVGIGADAFYILTDVPKVYLDFRKPGERPLDTMTVAEARAYLAQGQFAEGSMAPKVQAGLFFVEKGGGECIITEARGLDDPSCGTRIIR